jgi:hypothetical protein
MIRQLMAALHDRFELAALPGHLGVGAYDKKGRLDCQAIEKVKQGGQGMAIDGIVLLGRASTTVAPPDSPQPVEINLDKSDWPPRRGFRLRAFILHSEFRIRHSVIALPGIL